MNEQDPRLAAMDARLRRLFAGLDVREGFDTRLAARIAALPALPRADLRAQFERRREIAMNRLRRQAALNAVTVAGVGAAALAVFWHYAPAIERLLAGPGPALDPRWMIAGTLGVVAAGLWPLLMRFGLPR